jgi:hypothetical protein
VALVYFVAGDRERLDAVRRSQASLTHRDERFLLDAPIPSYVGHVSETAGANVNSVFSGVTEHNGRRCRLFHKPLFGVEQPTARAYGQNSLIDVGINEISAWRLARELGSPWRELVTPAVWFDPPGALDIRMSGPVLMGMGGSAGMPQPGDGFDTLISDAAFFDGLIGAQDRHHQNLRAALPPSLGLIDHGFTFARPGDFHNTYPTAGFFQRLRWGQRRFVLRHGPILDYSAVGTLSPRLTTDERDAITRLLDDSVLLGLTEILPDDRSAALRDRARRMDRAQEILPAADF